jgi:protocatechuate 3,4-dioxygenase beta subunit
LVFDLNVQILLGGPKVLAGRVVDESGRPVGDADTSIAVMLIADGDEPRYIAGKVSEPLFSRRTDAEGRFRFERIPANASAEFIVKKPGFATVGTLKEIGVQQLQFKTGQEDIEIKLPVEAKIKGTVVDGQTGQPVPGIEVAAFQGERQPFSGQEPVTSGKDGTFAIGALCPGKQILRAALGEERSTDWIAEPVELSVETGRTLTGVKVKLSKGGVAKICITELDDNRPISGATVTIRNTVSKQQFALVTGEDGMIRKRLAPGEYKVAYAFKQDFPYQKIDSAFTIEDGKTCPVEFQLKGYPRVSGTVRDEKGQPVAGAKVKVCPLGRGEATTDAEGRYEVRRETPEWAQGTVPFVVARHFERNLAGAVEFADDTKVVDVTIKPGVTCVGKVVDPNGKPIENAKVYLTFWSWGSGSSMAHEKNVTNAEGRYEIKAVPRHPRYSVEASAEGYGQDYLTISTEDANDRFEVEPISLGKANLSVSGIVVDMDDKPVENAEVYCQGRGQPYRRTQTDPDGRFTLENVCAGKIRVYAGTRSAPQAHGRIETEGGATDVTVVVSENPSSARYQPKRSPSLVGKPLPDLRELGIDLTPDKVEGKRLLVCFWDMNQRPSRHCLTQLVKQAESLRDRGVVVVAIQASKVKRNALHGYVKKYDVPFSVGMVQGDAEKTRFAWGVQSLPWLILTDGRHIVTAEGWRIDELDEKIAEAQDAG